MRTCVDLTRPSGSHLDAQALKRRPPPFVVQLRYTNGIGEFRIGLNIAALVHRALGRLPKTVLPEETTISWRMTVVDPNELILAYRPKANFTIASNRNDKEAKQPPHFKQFPLRPEQRRALTWMKQQETKKASPFVEEEVSEAFLTPMGWRAEGRAERSNLVFGGVLADEVGFGKTATTVGLIDATLETPKPDLDDGVGASHISINATLIFVPGHLCKQWPTEIEKFVGKRTLKVVTIINMGSLMSKTVEDFVEADIVVVSAGLFNACYWQRASLFAGVEVVPHNADGRATRHFTTRLAAAVEGTRERVKVLNDKGPKAAIKAVDADRKAGRTDVYEKVRCPVSYASAGLDAAQAGKGKMDHTDPWQLRTAKAMSDMHGPPLHCFQCVSTPSSRL